MIEYKLPLNEVVFDFYDRLKSITRGYASFDYELAGYKVNDLVKVSVMINGDPVDALSLIAHRDRSQSRGRALCERLKDLIPRQQFKVALIHGSSILIIFTGSGMSVGLCKSIILPSFIFIL